MTVIKLTWPEMQQGAAVGCQRRLRAMELHRNTVVLAENMRGQWGIDIEAAQAEMAVAKYLGAYWADDHAPDYGGDVGTLHVRSTPHNTGHLLIYPNDLDGGIFVLVIVSCNWFKIVGQIMAKEAKGRTDWWNESMHVPCWAVPQDHLIPLAKPD